MSDTPFSEQSFIEEAEAIVVEHLSEEQFGVSELAAAMNMSRSNLLRKIKKETKLSVSQFIRQIRLKKGMELLRKSDVTVSEVSYEVGFGSTSYFIKCFREFYGYPPGEVGKREVEEILKEESKPKHPYWKLFAGLAAIAFIAWYFISREWSAPPEIELEKSVAVLPFKNDSDDTTNVYFVNGLMESTLNNLQKIEDLRVISRTSVEKYRNLDRSIPEIAKELNVNYLVEGSGQRIGNKVLLNIQLIDASSDRQVWAQQYSREVGDVFTMQNEVARKIAEAIEAIVTPEELELIEKTPTENLVAYDYYLQALDPYYSRTKEGLETAISLFEKAIEQDPTFDQAYANIAISYYFLDLYQRQKQYTELINNYADKALLYDSKSDISLIAKALFYMHIEDFRLALPHLEKALEYNPNSAAVVQVLSSLYANYIPNTAKFLEYALMGIQLDIAANDSVGKSYIYLNLSNALVQTGFTEMAGKYINKSLDYDPNNYYAPYLKAFIDYAKGGSIEQTKKALINELDKDSTRLDILQEVAKLYYFEEDYQIAFDYYQKFANARKENNLSMYPQEDLKIGMVYLKMGLAEQANEFIRNYAEYCKNDISIYKSASTAMLLVHEGKLDEAMEQLKVFSEQDNYQYWILLFLEEDPVIDPLKSHPEYDATIQKIKDRFWDNHEQLKMSLQEKGLI